MVPEWPANLGGVWASFEAAPDSSDGSAPRTAASSPLPEADASVHQSLARRRAASPGSWTFRESWPIRDREPGVPEGPTVLGRDPNFRPGSDIPSEPSAILYTAVSSAGPLLQRSRGDARFNLSVRACASVHWLELAAPAYPRLVIQPSKPRATITRGRGNPGSWRRRTERGCTSR
jgi:hypothetical protein